MVLYRRDWPEHFGQLEIELACYLHKLQPEDGGLGPAQHFMNACEILWPPGNRCHIVWHPWAIRMIEEAIRLSTFPNGLNNLSIAGAASSGKSFTFGAYALVNWLAAPQDTLVLVTSTTLKESRKRIWGVICLMFSYAEVELPAKLIDSVGAIRTVVPGKKPNDMSGIHLVAGEKKKEKAAIDKLIGVKAQRVFLIADELTSLSPALIEAGSNLRNNPFYQMIGLGNASSIHDPHGQMSEPKDGWTSVDVETEAGWETSQGYCLRFDAEESPNVLQDKEVYPFMPSREKVEQARAQFGAKSRQYCRMYRSIWFADEEDAGVFSDADLLRSQASRSEVRWMEPPQAVAGLDLGYSNNGDRTILVYGLCGKNSDGIPVILIQGHYRLLDDTSKKDEPRNFQIARQVMELCKKHRIPPQHLGVDGTGAGGTFVDILTYVWAPGIVSITFGGWPSDRELYHNGARRLAKEVYSNRASEMWGEARNFVSNGQIRGVFPALAQELTSRKFVDRKRGDSVLLAVESKQALKARTGKSCDIADAALVMVDVCRTKLRFKAARIAHEKGEASEAMMRSIKREKWKRMIRKFDVDAGSGNFLVDSEAPAFSLW